MTQFFITGTDTDVGKTVASAFLVSKLKAHYWKPVQSGLSDGRDLETVQAMSQIDQSRILDSLYEFEAPLSPHEAARLENRVIDFERFERADFNGPLIVEGAGGVFVPLNDQYLMIDLMVKLNYPVILVARSSLGTINHTLLSLKALRDYNLPVKGVIMSGELNPKNREAIEFYGQVPILCEIPFLGEFSPDIFDQIDLAL